VTSKDLFIEGSARGPRLRIDLLLKQRGELEGTLRGE
jgi:hypothetical protein